MIKIVRVGEWFVNLDAPDPKLDWPQLIFSAGVIVGILLTVVLFAWI